MEHNSTAFYQRIFSLTLLWIIFVTITSSNAAVCPPPEEIEPCVCSQGETTISYITCSGLKITQNVLAECIETTRAANNLSAPEKLHVTNFYVQRTTMTTLDLSPFLLVRLGALNMINNLLLRSIVGPDLTTNRGALEMGMFYISLSPITDSGLGDALKYLSPAVTTTMYITQTRITGGQYNVTDEQGQSTTEFLPGLSQLTNLGSFIVDYNDIKEVFGGQFRKNTKLTQISFWGNRGLKFGENAFLMDELSEDFYNFTLTVSLASNGFESSDFNNFNRMDPMLRPMRLRFVSQNQMDYLAVEFFLHFLLGNPMNALLFSSTEFECDSKMFWLKDQKDYFQYRVDGCVCKNYPRFTCFNFPENVK